MSGVTERERMQERSHKFLLTIVKWSLWGLLGIIFIGSLNSILTGSDAARARKAEAALRECQNQHEPSRAESFMRWLASPRRQ